MTTYMEEDLLRSVKALAAHRGGKIYEVLDDALRRYLEEAEAARSPQPRGLSLAEALSESKPLRTPGVPRERAVKLDEGETLSGTVLAERESRSY